MKERVARAREKSFSGPGNGKNTPKFSKVRHVGSRVHQKLFKSARIPSDKKIFGFLLGSACIATAPGGFIRQNLFELAQENLDVVSVRTVLSSVVLVLIDCL